MKDINTTVAAFAFFGMVHYSIKWYRRDGEVDVDGLAESFVEIFTRGILKQDREGTPLHSNKRKGKER
jgi:hypothetical protein